MQSVTTIGLDIAKSVFQVHGVDAAGQVIIRRQLKLVTCWHSFRSYHRAWSALKLARRHIIGHVSFRHLATASLMPPAYVKPYVKRQKNDATDAEAICEAVTRANMRIVPTKTPEQQSGLVLHRTAICSSASRLSDQCDPGSSCRVRDRCAGRAQRCRGTARCRRQSKR